MGLDGIGSLEWGRRTQGRLTRGQCVALTGLALIDAVDLGRSRLRYALGRRGTDRPLGPAPWTPLVQAVDEAAQRQDPKVYAHAVRTAEFARALADARRLEVDHELLWSACLLHDIGLEPTVPGQCFAVRGAFAAERIAGDAGAEDWQATSIADAVGRHLTPRLSVARHPLPALVAAGALIDLLGCDLDRLDPAFVHQVRVANPSDHDHRHIADAWRSEAGGVPCGRAAVAFRIGFSFLVRHQR